jgi:hypothetical protein
LKMRILGLDVGGVIKQRGTPIPDAIESINALVHHFDSICIVSRINDAAEGEGNLNYLRSHGLLLIIPEERVFFCEKRHEKAPICAAQGVTHFVDDRPEVLSYMNTVPYKFALNPTQDQLTAFPVEGMKVVQSWKELLPLLMNQ